MGDKSAISKYGLFGTIKLIRVRKREKKDYKKNIRQKSQYISSYDGKASSSSVGSNKSVYEGIKVRDYDEKENKDKEVKKPKEKVKVESSKATNPNLISFNHELTEFEYKLRYVNLKDMDGQEYGRFFPPIRSKLVIINEEGRKFSIVRAGNNQISGDVLAFFNSEGLKPGNVFSIEYDREERSDDGLPVIRLKIKKE